MNTITPESLQLMGTIPVDETLLGLLRRTHAADVGLYRGQFAVVANQLAHLKGRIASEARSNLTATGAKVTEKAVEEQVDTNPEVIELRKQRDMLEAAVATLSSREAMLGQIPC